MSDIRSAIRRRWRLDTVSGRLSFYYVGTLALSLLVFAGFVLIVRAGSLRAELDADLTSRAASLATDLAPLLDRPDLAAVLGAEPGAAYALLTLRRTDGTLVYRSSGVPALAPASERVAEVAAANRLEFQNLRGATGQKLRLINRFVTSPAGATLAVQLVMPADGISRGIRQLAIAQAVGILLVLATAKYGSAFTARRALAPIDEIIRRGRDIRGQELGKRLDVHADTVEIEQLVDSLNQMVARLEEPVVSAHRFAASVSHELQTPIAAMRFAVEAAQEADSLAEVQRITVDLLAELDRLSVLIRDLRLLAVAGAGQLLATPQPFQLDLVVQQCCEIAKAVAESKNIRVEEQLERGLTVVGSPLHLRRVILNLTDNAIRYSPPHSTVVVRMEAEERAAAISVTDHGCGISRGDQPKIFEPFFRTDRARARETGGSGLGLAIADQIVRVHRGRITVTSAPGEGSTFTIHLPTISSSTPHE